MDEHSREALQIVVDRRIDADGTVAALDRIVTARGTAPRFIRCDNGPELTANALRDWCRFSGTGTSYIEPGCPWENPYVESFGGRLRDELLSSEQFDTLLEAQVLIEDWRIDYNHNGLTQALDGWPRSSTLGNGGASKFNWTGSHKRWTDERGLVMPKTHAATIGRFGELLMSEGLEREVGRALNILAQRRQRVGYEWMPTLQEDAEGAIEQVHLVLSAARLILERYGLESPPS